MKLRGARLRPPPGPGNTRHRSAQTPDRTPHPLEIEQAWMRQPTEPTRNLPACAGAGGGRLCRSAQTGPHCTLYTKVYGIDGIKPYHRVSEVLIGRAAVAGRAASSGGLLTSAKSAGRMLGLGIAALALPENCASEIDSVLAAGSRPRFEHLRAFILPRLPRTTVTRTAVLTYLPLPGKSIHSQ